MQPSLNLIESFAQIVRAGSLSQAEKLTGQSKATLSRQLLKLEQMLGTQLLTRTPRKLVLTEAGRAYHAHQNIAALQICDLNWAGPAVALQ